MTPLVVWNPSAGSKAGLPTNGTSEPELRAVMARHGLGTDLFESPSEDATAARIEAAIAGGATTIVAAGGDGTVRSVALRILGRPVRLGILPLGSAMNVARSLGIPRDLDGAAAILAAGRERSVDVGELRRPGRPPQAFLEVVSVGLNADVLAAAQEVDRRRFASLLSMFGAGLRHPRVRVSVRLDDGPVVRAKVLTLAVANSPYTGLGMALAPDARLDDGRFDVVLFSAMGRWELAWHLLATIGGRQRRTERTATHRAARVRLEAERPLGVRLDSRDAGETPVELVVRPGALAVVAP